MKIEQEVLKLKPQMEKDKEFLWNHPEKGLCEFETSSYIKKRLEEIGKILGGWIKSCLKE